MSPELQSLMARVAALENGTTASTLQRGGAPVSQPMAIKVVVPVSANVGQVVRLLSGSWFLGDSTQPERALVGVVSRVITPASCEVVLWGLRYALGDPGTFYYMSTTPGEISDTPPDIGTGTDHEEATEEWTHIIEVQVTPTYRLVRPDAWKRRVQRVQVCELVDDVPTQSERIICELTDEPDEA